MSSDATIKQLRPTDDISTALCGGSTCKPAPNGQAKANGLFEACFGTCFGGKIYSRLPTNSIPPSSILKSATLTFQCCDVNGNPSTCNGDTVYLYSATGDQGDVWSEKDVSYCPETAGCTIPGLPTTPETVTSAIEGTNSVTFSGSSLVFVLQSAVSAAETATLSVWFAYGAGHTFEYYCSNNSSYPPILSAEY
jgi:hypothetical protein